jgi:type IV pilus assembly protein PilN
MESINLNLLPLEYRVKKSDFSWILARRFIYPAVGLIIALGVVMVFWLSKRDEFYQKQQKLTTLEAQIRKHDADIKNVSQLKKDTEKINLKVRALQSIDVSRRRWITIFENLNTVLPSNTWFKKLEQPKGQEHQLNLTGNTFQFSEVAQYMLHVESELAIDKVILKKIKTVKLGSENVFEFDLLLNLNKELGLESAGSNIQ